MRSAQETQDVMRVASNVYELIMENDKVRMLRASFKPGDKAMMHNHPDHAVYVVKGGKLHLSYPNGGGDDMEMESGQGVFIPAQTHEATNIGGTDVELVVIEIK